MTGRRVVNTRAVHQHSRLSACLAAQGAEVLEYPCLAIVPPRDPAPLCAALAALGSFDWLVLTSANTVSALAEFGLSSFPRVAAVGPTTARQTRTLLGLDPTLLPEHFTAEELARALPVVAGERVLIPGSSLSRPQLATTLRERGAEVTVVDAYETALGTGGAPVPRLLAERQIDAVTFTSSSTVDHFLLRLTQEGGSRTDLEGVCLAAIGPQTATSLRDAGLPLSVQAEPHTLDGLVAALVSYFSRP